MGPTSECSCVRELAGLDKPGVPLAQEDPFLSSSESGPNLFSSLSLRDCPAHSCPTSGAILPNTQVSPPRHTSPCYSFCQKCLPALSVHEILPSYRAPIPELPSASPRGSSWHPPKRWVLACHSARALPDLAPQMSGLPPGPLPLQDMPPPWPWTCRAPSLPDLPLFLLRAAVTTQAHYGA